MGPSALHRPWRRPAALVAALAACAAALTAAAPAGAGTRTFEAIADATVQQSSPSRALGRSDELVVGRGRQAYLKFKVALPGDEQLVSARLRLRPEWAVTVRLASNRWTERRISWSNRPRPGKRVTGFRRTGTVTYVLSSGARELVRYASRESGLGPTLVVTTRSTATATAGPVTDPSGEPVASADRPGWRNVFFDDFSRDVPLGQFPQAVSERWWAYPAGWKDTSKRGTYDPGKVLSVHDGVLDYHLHSADGRHYVGAPVPRLPGTLRGVTSTPSGQLYGRYSVRYRADPVAGYKIAWLLWPDSKQFPRDGEIDFPEGDLSLNTISAYVHHQGAVKTWDQAPFHAWASPTEWHTATIDWMPGRVVFWLDGQVIGQTTKRIPNTPMHWVLQAETNTDGNPVPSSSRGHVLIDWVSVWAPAG